MSGNLEGDLEEAEPEQGPAVLRVTYFCIVHRRTRAQDKAREGDESSTMTKVEKKNSVKANGTKMFANKAETRVMFGHKEKKTSACLPVSFKVMLTF